LSRTRRAYNYPQKLLFKYFTRSAFFSIPADLLKHAVLCMGNCHYCKDKKRDQQEKTEKREHFILSQKGL